MSIQTIEWIDDHLYTDWPLADALIHLTDSLLSREMVGVDLAVDAMRDSLAVTLQRFEAAKAISITVTGVQSIADYRAVSSVFEALSQLVELRIDAIRGDILMYRVAGVSSAQEVARLLPRRSGLRIQSASDPAQLDLIWESIQ